MLIENIKAGFAKFAEYSVYVFLLIFPFFIFKSFLYQGSSTRFLLLTIVSALLAISFGVYLLSKRNRVYFFRSPILITLSFYLLYLFVSALLGADFTTSFWSKIERTSALFYLVHLAPFLLIMIHLFSQEKIKERLLKIILGTSAVYSFLSVLGPQGFKVMFKNVPYDGFWFGNSTFAAMYLLGAFLLSIYYIFRRPVKEIKWYQWLLPLVIFFNPFLFNIKVFKEGIISVTSILGIAMASSVSVFVALGILLVIFLISRIKNIKNRNIIAIFTATLSLVVLAFTVQSLLSGDGYIRKVYEKGSTLARPVVWDISKEAIKDRPVTGWGIDNFNLAFQENFDNRLLEAKYGNEPWFDRSHNIILDQTVDTGYVGIVLYLLVYIIIIASLLYVVLWTKERDDAVLGSVLISYFFVHILELQTAFDTTISYIILSVMTALSVVLFQKIKNQEKNGSYFIPNQTVKIILGITFIIFFGWSLLFGSIPFWKMQIANGKMREVGTTDKRIPYYSQIFKTKVDTAGVLWRISNDFQKGISETPEIVEDPKRSVKLLEELDLFTLEYEKYTSAHPDNFRMKINLADLYIYHLLFGVDMLDKADATLDEALLLVPNHPQPYVMKAVTHVYRNDFKGARVYVQKAEEINPDSIQVQRVKSYLEESQKTFPEIELFFFGQI